MSKRSGRNIKIYDQSTLIGVVRAKTISWSGEPIDITSDDDSGFRTHLGTAQGQEQIDLSVEGIADADALKDMALNPATSKLISNLRIVWEDTGDELAGAFVLTSFENTGPYNEAEAFSASLQSSGQWTYTPA